MTVADELQKLDDLRKSGLLNDAEFEQQKQRLLAGETLNKPARAESIAWATLPLKNKLWFQGLFTIFLTPIGIIFMMLVPAYQNSGGTAVKAGKPTKAIFIVCGLFLWLLGLARMSQSDSVTGQTQTSATTASPASSVSAQATSGRLPSCDDPNIIQTLKNMTADSPEGRSGLLTLNNISTIIDVTEQYSPGKADYTRYEVCHGTFETNAGSEVHKYEITWRDGKAFVDIMGEDQVQRW